MFFEFLLEHADKVIVELAVHKQDIVSTVGGSVDIGILCHGIGGVEIYDIAVAVGLLGFDKGLVFFECEILPSVSFTRTNFMAASQNFSSVSMPYSIKTFMSSHFFS